MRTVLVAGGVNLLIAVAKTAAGMLSGSSALLAEAAHSVADTLNQVFLFTALRRSARPADAEHQFGYGAERYFWALLAAVGIFVLGAGFSILEGVQAILHPQPLTELVVAYLVLALSFALEGTSWLRALGQVHREAGQAGVGTMEHLRSMSDPTAKTVAFEDTAALIGILLATAGLTLHAITGVGWWDGAASIAIGVLLVVTAQALGRENKENLIGRSVPADVQRAIRDIIVDSPGVDSVVELMTLRLGPGEVLVAARVDIDDKISGGTVEKQAETVDQRLRARFPEVTHVFLDPTDAPPPR
ncbi:MAG: cation diffusion facilitator family transporter [Nocardioidaceae bacterium]